MRGRALAGSAALLLAAAGGACAQPIALFAEADVTGRPEVLYVPVRPGCEFQPYQLASDNDAVRGR